jgi:hypothetical protein
MATTLNVRFLADTVGFAKGIKGAKGDLTGFEKATKNASKNIGKALGAISFVAVVRGLTQMAKNAQEDAIAQELLANQIRNVTNATDDDVKAINDYIDATSKQYGIVDDKLRPAMSRLVTITGDTAEATKLFELAMNASAATGKPLEMVATALGKAYNGQFASLNKLGIPMLDSVENAKALTKESKKLEVAQLEYNYALTEYGPKSKEAIKAAEKVAEVQQKVNDIAQAGTDWQKDLGNAFAGAAEKAINPMQRLQVVFDEAKETIGGAFLPVIEQVITVLTPLIDDIAPVLAKLIQSLAPIFVKLVNALLPLIEQLLPPLVELLDALMPVIIPLVEILTDLLVPTVKVLVQVFKFLLKAVSPIIAAIASLINGMKQGFTGFASFFKGIINGWLGYVQSFINFFIGGINNLIKTANKGLGFLGDLIGQKLTVSLLGTVSIPKLANGGIVSPSPGGSIVNVAEAGEAEAIIPLSKLGNVGGGNTYVININKAAISGEEVVRAIRRYENGLGRTSLV